MKTNFFEMIHSGDFQEKIVLTKSDALVNVTTEGNIVSHLGSHFLEDIARGYRDKMKFYSLDQGKDHGLSHTYGVESAPTILLFKKGTLVDKLSGLVHRTTIAAKVHSLLNH